MALQLDRCGSRSILWDCDSDNIRRMLQTRCNQRYLPGVDLPRYLAAGGPVSSLGHDEPKGEVVEVEPRSLAEVQKDHIALALRYTGGKKAPAARLLGIDVKTLYSKIRTYGIEV